MEMKHKICSSLHMIMGEIGPVEVELLFTIIYMSVGIFGSDSFNVGLCDIAGLSMDCILQ